MRRIGIDYGTKRVGVSLSDESGKMAFPHGVFSNDDTLLKNIVTCETHREIVETILKDK